MSRVCQACGVRACGAVVDGLCEDCRDLGIVLGTPEAGDKPGSEDPKEVSNLSAFDGNP